MSKTVPNRQIAEEAADWTIRIDSGPLSGDERRALADWLRGSPAHVDELLFAASILGGLQGVDRDRKLSVDEYLADAAPNTIPLFGEQKSSGGKQVVIPCPVSSSAPTRPRRWALAASLALIAMVGLILAQAWPGNFADRGRLVSAPASRTFATDVGEQRSIALADGSVVFLNTNSRAVVRLSASERRIDLMKGEALFEVASDPSRPFRVHAAGTMTQAVGTKFNVRHIGTGIRVVVVEGKVLVDSRPSKAVERGRTVARNAVSGRRPTDQALLTAGQQVEFRANAGTPVVAEADIVTAASWRMRQLSFDDAGLDEIVAEFNRYNRTPIVLADPTLGRIRLSGVFDANDPRSFMAFIELSTSVEVDRTELNRIVLRPRRTAQNVVPR